MYIETVYVLNILLTLFAVGIVSLMVKNEVRVYGNVRLFTYILSSLYFGLVLLLWYGMYCGILAGEINWWIQ